MKLSIFEAFAVAASFLQISTHALALPPYIQKLEDAAKEAEQYGTKDFMEWGLTPGKATYHLNHTTIFDFSDTKGTDISCFRIPSVVQTESGVLIAFAEARGRFPKGSCADNSPLGIATKRSLDGGLSWDKLKFAVDPYFLGVSGQNDTNAGGNPVAVFDRVRKQVILHFVRGKVGNGGPKAYGWGGGRSKFWNFCVRTL